MLDTLGGEAAQLLQAPGEAIARALELGDVRQPRTGAYGGRGGGCRDVRETLGHNRRELALQARDLSPQRAPRGELALALASDRPEDGGAGIEN
jgi:hypothetical protein